MLFLKNKASHASSLMQTFQWLPIMLCIKAKLLINAKKAPASVSGPITNQAPRSTAHQPHRPSFCSANAPCLLLPESPHTTWSLCLEGSSWSSYAWLLCHWGLSLHENTSYFQSQVATQSLPHYSLLILSVALCPWHFWCVLDTFMLIIKSDC